MEIAWGPLIYLYLWLAGIGGGAFFSAFLIDRFTGGQNKSLVKLATYIAFPLTSVGVLLLIADLGMPTRFWHLLTRFYVTTPMSLGSWILIFFVGISVVLIILWWWLARHQSNFLSTVERFLVWIEVVFSALVMTYTGVLLAVSGQGLWAGTVILPALFVASATSTGLAATLIAATVRGSRDASRELLLKLSEADAIVILLELVALIGFMIWLATSSVAGASQALAVITMGGLAIPLWLGVVIVGLLIPLALEFWGWGKSIATKNLWPAIITSSTLVLIGGLILRAVIVIGGQVG